MYYKITIKVLKIKFIPTEKCNEAKFDNFLINLFQYNSPNIIKTIFSSCILAHKLDKLSEIKRLNSTNKQNFAERFT